MGKIIELRPRDMPPPHGEDGANPTPGPASIEDATQRLIGSVRELIRILEMSHQRIRVLIDMIPDEDAAARLARDHALLSAALREAKAKVVSLGLKDPAKPKP
jgi:hypothetical protein